MPKSFATLIDEVQQELQDTAGATWADPELTIQLEDAIREVSDYDQYEMMETLKIESRTGSATGTTSNALVDATNAQFLSTDVDKEIYNTTDRTWAVVTAFVSASQLTLSKDIMAVDENYAIFNKGCRNNNQVNIEDVTDFIDPPQHGVARGYVEHPIGNRRNFTIEGDILTIDVDTLDDSADSDADVEVYVWFKKSHRVSQLTDLAGTVDGTPAAGAETMAVDDFTGTEIIAEDTLFTVTGIRGTYRITQDTTLSSGAGTIYFWPGLESAGTDGNVITIIGSTLNTRLERLVVELTAARAAMSKGMLSIAQVSSAITLLATINSTVDAMSADITLATADLASGRSETAKVPAIIKKAETAITFLRGQITQAVADMNTGKPLINEINKGGATVPSTYLNYGTTALSNATGYANEARTLLQQARADESLSGTYRGLASSELSKAAAQLNQAGGYMRELTTRLNVASSFRLYQDWGERKLGIVLAKLEKLQSQRKPLSKHLFPKD